MLAKILPVALYIYAGYSIAKVLWQERQKLHLVPVNIWKRFSLPMFCLVLGQFIGVLLLAVALRSLKIPLFNWAWSDWFVKGGGNITASPFAVHGGPMTKVLQTIFFVALICALPFLALYEEKIFRSNKLRWKQVVVASIAFGFVHPLLAGVPVYAGLCLSLSGLFLACIYRREYHRILGQGMSESFADHEATMQAGAYHTLHNSIFVVLIFIGAML